MYPRNSASPPRISVGAVVQISDGAVQTAGVSIVVRPEGGAETAGAGTISYGATSGIVYYTPTQAETDYTAFVVVAYKTGCIPAEKAVITSASATAGHAGTDQSKIANPTSTVNLSATTIKTATDVETDTQDIQSRIPAALVDGRMVSLAQAVTDKSGYKLESDGLSLVTQWAVAITGNITGNLVGDVTGEVAELGPNALSANSLDDQISLAVWNALTTATYVDQSFGDRLLISANNTRQVAVTGNGHVASVLHDAEPNSIPEDAFQDNAISARAIGTDAIDADALASSANTEIANAVAATQALSRLDSMIESDGNGQFRFDTIAVSLAAQGGGGGAVNISVEDQSITVC